MHPVAIQLNDLRTELGAFYRERDDVIYAMLLAILAKQHGFILGPPGTAKSEMVRAIFEAIVGARYFEALLSKNRPAEAVNGPLDLKLFRETGDYKLKRAGYATQVEFLFLDEVGKMSPVLGHDLLALLNERVYHEVNGGLSVHQAPLYSGLTAANEMPTNESDDAAALWDRLLVRVIVDYVQDDSNFASLLTAERPAFGTQIDWAELADVIDNEVPAVKITDDALLAIVGLRKRLAKEHIYPSDRRFRQSMRVLKAAAFLDGRSEVVEDDVAALRFTLWDTVEQVEKIAHMALSVANPFYEDLLQVRTGIQEIALGVTERLAESEGNRIAFGKEANTKLREARKALDGLMHQSPARSIPGFKQVADMHETVTLDVFVRMMGQDEDVAEIAIKKRLGLGNGEDFWKKD